MASRAQRNAQQNFFSQMQTLFFGAAQGGDDHGGGGIVGSLKDAAEDLKMAAHMLNQGGGGSGGKPTYGGPNGNRPTMNWNQAQRPEVWGEGKYPGGTQYNGTFAAARSGLASAVFNYAGSTGGIFSRGNTFSQGTHANGKEYYIEHDSQGRPIGTHEEGTAGFAGAKAHFQRQNQVGAVSNAIQSGSLYTGNSGKTQIPGLSIAQNIASHIPGVGKFIAGAMGATVGGFEATVDQRQKNAQYQSVLGGSNFSTGFQNRRLLEGFKLHELFSGGMSGAQAEELFNGVTNLGYSGNLRQEALMLGDSNYKNLGMSAGETVGFVTSMSKSANRNFEDLKTALNAVSDAAKQTGQNLEVARAGLKSLIDIATQSGGGNGALTSAASLATFSTSMGRTFSPTTFAGLTPGANMGISAMMANSAGMSMGAFDIQQAGGGATAQTTLAKARDKQLATVIAPILNNPQVMAVINQMAQMYRQQRNQDPKGNIENFAQFCMQQPSFQQALGNQIFSIQSAATAMTGAQINTQQAVILLLSQALGTNTFEQQNAKGQAAVAQMTGDQIAKQLGANGMKMFGLTEKNGQIFQGGKNVTAQLQQSRDANPILKKFAAQYNNNDVRMQVQTADGARIVTGKTALAEYQDQIAKGTAIFMNGSAAGQTVADVVGGGYAESNYVGKDTTSSKDPLGGLTNKNIPILGNISQTVQNYNAKNNNNVSGTVTISPSPQLAQLLSISATGNISVANQAAASGLVPSPNQTSTIPGLGGN